MENPIRIDDFGGTTRGITILGNLHMRHASSLIVIIVILLLVICLWRLHGSPGVPSESGSLHPGRVKNQWNDVRGHTSPNG